MKKAYKLLILLLILAASIGLGITYTEARVCFVVGGCDKDDAAKPKAKVQDCPALGFKYVADGRKMDKNEGGIAKYVGKEGPCTKNGKAYFKQKVCKNKYAYVASTTINRIDSETGEIKKIEGLEALDLIKKALSTNYHRADVSVCGENATPGENFCDDSYGLKSAEVTSVRKYTQCTCDAKYKYLAEDIRTGFKIPYDQGAKSCTTSGVDGNDGKLRYDLVKCSGDYEAGGYWKETCGTKEYAFRSDTWGDLTCNLCMEGQQPDPDPCADGSCDNPTSPCTGANLYDTSTACFEGNGAGDIRSYTCREIMVGDAVCYERSYVSCAELSKVEYYGADDGYYGYYGSGVRGAFIQYFDTVDECMNGIASNEVCSSKTLWSDTYYGAFDGKVCYYREKRNVTRTCADYGHYDDVDSCRGVAKKRQIVTLTKEQMLERLNKEDLIKPYDKSELFGKIGKVDIINRLDKPLILERFNKDDFVKPLNKTDLIGKLGKETLVARLDADVLATRVEKAELAKAFSKDELLASFNKDELVNKFGGATAVAARVDTAKMQPKRMAKAMGTSELASAKAGFAGANVAAMTASEKTAMVASLDKSELFASYTPAEVVDKLDRTDLINRLGKDTVAKRIDAEKVLNRIEVPELVATFDKAELLDKFGKETLLKKFDENTLIARLNKEDMVKAFDRTDLIKKLGREDLMSRLERAGMLKEVIEESSEGSYGCQVIMTNGLTCYARVDIDCGMFSIYGSVPRGYYTYYYGPSVDGTIIYYNTYEECMRNATGEGCSSKIIQGKTCYYKNKAEGKTLMKRVEDLFSGIANKFTKTFDKNEAVRVDGITDVQRTTKFLENEAVKSVDGIATQRHDGVPTKYFESEAAKAVANQRASELSTRRVGSEMAVNRGIK